MMLFYPLASTAVAVDGFVPTYLTVPRVPVETFVVMLHAIVPMLCGRVTCGLGDAVHASEAVAPFPAVGHKRHQITIGKHSIQRDALALGPAGFPRPEHRRLAHEREEPHAAPAPVPLDDCDELFFIARYVEIRARREVHGSAGFNGV